jgi:acyl-CoA oxidase
LAENRLVGLRADLDIYVTFEGDNNVLLQLVAKRLLTDVSDTFRDAGPAALAKLALENVVDRTLTGSGLQRLGQTVVDLGATSRSVENLRQSDVQRALLAERVEHMVMSIAATLRHAKKEGRAAEAFNENQSALIEAAIAHGELLQWEAFTAALDAIKDPDTHIVLTWLRDLFGFGIIEKHAAWYLMSARLSSHRALAVTAYIDRLIARLRPHAQDLVDAFGYGPEHLRAPIASGEEAQRQEEARAYFADPSRRFAPKESVATKPKAKKPAAE